MAGYACRARRSDGRNGDEPFRPFVLRPRDAGRAGRRAPPAGAKRESLAPRTGVQQDVAGETALARRGSLSERQAATTGRRRPRMLTPFCSARMPVTVPYPRQRGSAGGAAISRAWVRPLPARAGTTGATYRGAAGSNWETALRHAEACRNGRHRPPGAGAPDAGAILPRGDDGARPCPGPRGSAGGAAISRAWARPLRERAGTTAATYRRAAGSRRETASATLGSPRAMSNGRRAIGTDRRAMGNDRRALALPPGSNADAGRRRRYPRSGRRHPVPPV